MADVLLDTTFLLPTLGVEVKEIGREDLQGLENLLKKNTLYCSYISFIEIFGKLAKNVKPSGLRAVRLGMKSLLESGTYHWVNPSLDALQAAFELRLKGHRDNIDNILYCTSMSFGMYFLSLDEDFKKWLKNNGYDVRRIVKVKELQAALREDH